MKTRDSSPPPVHVHVSETTPVHVHMRRTPSKILQVTGFKTFKLLEVERVHDIKLYVYITQFRLLFFFFKYIFSNFAYTKTKVILQSACFYPGIPLEPDK